MANIKIIGKCGEREISEYVMGYQCQVSEQIETTKKRILNKFKALGYDERLVEFEII